MGDADCASVYSGVICCVLLGYTMRTPEGTFFPVAGRQKMALDNLAAGVLLMRNTSTTLMCSLLKPSEEGRGGTQTSLHRRRTEVIRESAAQGKSSRLQSSCFWKCNHKTVTVHHW